MAIILEVITTAAAVVSAGASAIGTFFTARVAIRAERASATITRNSSQEGDDSVQMTGGLALAA